MKLYELIKILNDDIQVTLLDNQFGQVGRAPFHRPEEIEDKYLNWDIIEVCYFNTRRVLPVRIAEPVI